MLRQDIKTTYTVNASARSRMSFLLGFISIFLVNPIIVRINTKDRVTIEYVNGVRKRPLVSRIDVDMHTITVDTKNPSTTNCNVLVPIPFLRTAKSITPGKMNVAGKAIMAMNNGGMAVKEKPK